MNIRICLALCIAYAGVLKSSELTVTLSAAEREGQDEARVPLRIVSDGAADAVAVAKSVQKALVETGQMQVEVITDEAPHTREAVERHLSIGYPFVLYLSYDVATDSMVGRLYNTLDVLMLEGRRWYRRPTERQWAQAIAHDVWKSMMGVPGSFLARIAYVKRTTTRAGRVRSKICVAGWDGSDEQCVVERPAHLVGTTWSVVESADAAQQIFFSEFTPVNVRLMGVTLAGKVSKLIDFDGTTVGVSLIIESDGPVVVYCRSGNMWRYTHDSVTRKGKHECIVREQGLAAACPQQCPNGDLIYCAGGRIKKWQRDTNSSTFLTQSGFATCPALHAGTGEIIYSRRVGGVMQLFSCTEEGAQHRQLTRSSGDKVDPSISPCANFIIYCRTEGKKSEIWSFNRITQKERRLSAEGDFCLSPSWSPLA